jgi:HEAT repeats
MSGFRAIVGICTVGAIVASPVLADDKIERAVERGVNILRQSQQFNGCIGAYGAGSTALAALALLECGAKIDDEVITKAHSYVREQIIPGNDVYHVSLAIMFLDRLGDPADVPLIQALAVRLMEGQLPPPQAGWNYKTSRPGPDELERLRGQKSPELKTDPKKEKGPESPSNKLDPDLEARLEALERNGPLDPSRRTEGTGYSAATPDNSNSQFAVIALWIARRHRVPTDSALKRAEFWYRATYESGTWPYTHQGATPYGRGATTCAGLIGLAAGAGVARTPSMETKPNSKPPKPPPKRDVLADGQIQTALNYVGLELAAMATGGFPAANSERDLYFLWSLERVAMIYSLPKLATVDWYAVGSALIVAMQLPTGGWKVRYSVEIDTSFALLFLRRSNLAPDLSSMLKTKQQPTLSAKDPSENKAIQQPPAGEAEQLARELLTAGADRQDRILEKLRDEKGQEFSDALVKVIPQLTGETQRKARDCLAERMARMTAGTLRDKLRDDNPEYRRAAALACAVKEDRSLIAALIAALDDKEFLVVRAVAVSLRALTGEDFGPSANATIDERSKAIAAWKAWWKKQSP